MKQLGFEAKAAVTHGRREGTKPPTPEISPDLQGEQRWFIGWEKRAKQTEIKGKRGEGRSRRRTAASARRRRRRRGWPKGWGFGKECIERQGGSSNEEGKEGVKYLYTYMCENYL